MTKVKRWKITVNGSFSVTNKGLTASQMWTAVERTLKAHFEKFPKQRFWQTDIHVKCLGDA